MKRKLTKLEWAFLTVPAVAVAFFLGGQRFWFALMGTVSSQKENVDSILFSRDGKYISSVASTYIRRAPFGQNSELSVWNTSDGSLHWRTNIRYRVWSARLSSDNSVVSGPVEKKNGLTTYRWNLASGVQDTLPRPGADYIYLARDFPDQNKLVQFGNPTVVYNAQTLQPLLTLPLRFAKPNSFRITKNCSRIYFIAREPKAIQRVECWSLVNGRKLFSVPSQLTPMAMALSPDAKHLAVALASKSATIDTAFNNVQVVLFDALTGKQNKVFPRVKSVWWNAFQFSPDSKHLLCAGPIVTNGIATQGYVELLDIRTGQSILTQTTSASCDSSVFSPDGHLLATLMSNDSETETGGAVYLWNTRNGQLLNRFFKDMHQTPTAAFSPDNKTLAYSSGNKIHFVSVSNLN